MIDTTPLAVRALQAQAGELTPEGQGKLHVAIMAIVLVDRRQDAGQDVPLSAAHRIEQLIAEATGECAWCGFAHDDQRVSG